MNVGVILAAGKSSRFDNQIPKQLYPLNGKPIINFSIDILNQFLDKVIIVTNSSCSTQIKTDNTILVNDVDDRIKSISVALDYLQNKRYDNILIHDAARPYITSNLIHELLVSSETYKHSQYYLELVNGLAKKHNSGWKVAPRENFIELCSPQITDFEIFKHIFREYIQENIYCEVLPAMCDLKYEYNLIKGSNKYLRKITTIDDIY